MSQNVFGSLCNVKKYSLKIKIFWVFKFTYFFLADDFDQTMLSQEKLDRASPELWPEQSTYT